MTKIVFLLATTAAAALAVSACTPPTPRHHGGWSHDMKSISKLDCPDSQGVLKRQSAATDGKSCVYVDASGSEVTLQLVSLDGTDVKGALAPFETQLRAEMPPRPERAAGPAGNGGSGDNVDIDLPGVHIHARGDDAHVQAGQVNVQAGDHGAHVDVRKDVTEREDGKSVVVDSHDGRGGVTVDANDHGAEIHVDEGARHGVRMTYILASETPGPHGYKLAGYEVRGPREGPLALATVKSKSEDRDSLFHDMRRLLDHNLEG